MPLAGARIGFPPYCVLNGKGIFVLSTFLHCLASNKMFSKANGLSIVNACSKPAAFTPSITSVGWGRGVVGKQVNAAVFYTSKMWL